MRRLWKYRSADASLDVADDSLRMPQKHRNTEFLIGTTRASLSPSRVPQKYFCVSVFLWHANRNVMSLSTCRRTRDAINICCVKFLLFIYSRVVANADAHDVCVTSLPRGPVRTLARSAVPPGDAPIVNSSMERHNGSKEEGWKEEGREEDHQAEGHQEESHPQAPLARTLLKKKAGFAPAFLYL